jgi:hypothetical protein
MKIEEFQRRYGAEYRKFCKTDLFQALLIVISENEPIRTATNLPVTDGQGTALYSMCAGYEVLHRLLRETLKLKPVSEQPEQDYTTKES